MPWSDSDGPHNTENELYFCQFPASFPGQEAYGDHFKRNPILVKYTACPRVQLSVCIDKQHNQQWARLLTLLKSTALFSRLTSCLPSLLDGWDWGETVWPVRQSRKPTASQFHRGSDYRNTTFPHKDKGLQCWLRGTVTFSEIHDTTVDFCCRCWTFISVKV